MLVEKEPDMQIQSNFLIIHSDVGFDVDITLHLKVVIFFFFFTRIVIGWFVIKLFRLHRLINN